MAPRCSRSRARMAETFGMVQRRTGTASTCCTPRRRGSAGSTSASCPAAAAATSAGILDGAAEGRDRGRLSARRRRDRHGSHLAKAFVVYQGHHGDARRAPRRCDPAGRRLYREERAPTSTPKAGCSSGAGRVSRPARRARTGRSCARCPRRSASGCLTTPSASCAARLSEISPRFQRLDADRAGGLGRVRQGRRRSTPRPSRRRSPITT